MSAKSFGNLKCHWPLALGRKIYIPWQHLNGTYILKWKFNRCPVYFKIHAPTFQEIQMMKLGSWPGQHTQDSSQAETEEVDITASSFSHIDDSVQLGLTMLLEGCCLLCQVWLRLWAHPNSYELINIYVMYSSAIFHLSASQLSH